MTRQADIDVRVERNWVRRALTFHVGSRKVPFPVVAAFIGLGIFLADWLLACVFSEGGKYWDTSAFKFSCVAVAWVLGSVYWGLPEIPKRLNDLEKCFVGNQYRERILVKVVPWFSQSKGMLACALPIFCWGVEMEYRSLFLNAPPKAGILVAWHQGNLWANLVIILIMGASASLALGAGLWLFLVNLPLLYRLRNLRVVPMPGVLIAKFRIMTDFYLISTAAWFVAVGISALILFQNLSLDAQGFLLGTSVIGLSAFMFPQVQFHGFLVRAQQEVAGMAVDEFRSSMGTKHKIEYTRLGELNTLAPSYPTWVLDANDMIVLVLINVVTPLVLQLKSSGLLGK